MNNLGFGQKIYSFLVSAYKWYLWTPERSVEAAYQAALKIKALEDEHFQGNQISFENTSYSSSILDYFETDLQKHLKTVRMRLTEFQSSRFFLNESNQETAAKYGVQYSSEAVILEKLKIIDDITAKYTRLKIDDISEPQIKKNSQAIVPLNNNIKQANNKDISKANTTGVLPRSIFNTFSRLQIELDPKSEEDIVRNFRKSQRRTLISVRFLLLLIIVPTLTHQISKTFLVGPIINHVRHSEQVSIFINQEMEEEALEELQRFEERIKFENIIGMLAPISPEQMEVKVKEKAEEIATEYRRESANAIKNVFADICSVIAFVILLIASKREIVILKDFFDHIVYGLSDSAKAFIIILFTDVFVGFHSPHGWEVILEGLSRHWGLPANHDFIFLFIATFPVILDTIFKYWIFRYLNRISPSAVATYHNMNE
ncbi:proton extrusion protein PcxA [Calothrix sp. 336/3]|uniref:proton extrusion protein PcxA n=1 Tax=Calothrix sp. 336/3 TaxID=1337936 RepID=UPI0004E30AA6|nr:proton extrusion protein PcxA [Calothrix sp. 336/3]AKG20768.1 proton extrusion protein PcxA [Calothrix sp. 336/3]